MPENTDRKYTTAERGQLMLLVGLGGPLEVCDIAMREISPDEFNRILAEHDLAAEDQEELPIFRTVVTCPSGKRIVLETNTISTRCFARLAAPREHGNREVTAPARQPAAKAKPAKRKRRAAALA